MSTGGNIAFLENGEDIAVTRALSRRETCTYVVCGRGGEPRSQEQLIIHPPEPTSWDSSPAAFRGRSFPGQISRGLGEEKPPFRVTLSVKPKRLSLFRHSNASPCGEEPLNGTGTWLSCAKACSRNSCKMGHPQNPKSHGS